jgi:hypothetical protein
MPSHSGVSEAAYLGMTTVLALTIAIIVAGEINHLNRPLWRGQDLPHGGEIVVVVGIKDFSVLRELGRASRCSPLGSLHASGKFRWDQDS